MKKICEYCGKEFEANLKTRKFCCFKHARQFAAENKIGFYSEGWIRKPRPKGGDIK